MNLKKKTFTTSNAIKSVTRKNLQRMKEKHETLEKKKEKIKDQISGKMKMTMIFHLNL